MGKFSVWLTVKIMGIPVSYTHLNKIADTRQEQLRIEWFGNIRIGTAIIALDTLFVQRAGRQQNHRDMACL